MALRVKFYIRASNKTEIAKIAVRFTNGRKFDLRVLTEKQINPKFWNNEKGIVRQRAEFIEKDSFQRDLDDLNRFIMESYNNEKNISIVNKEWLLRIIDMYDHPEKYKDNSPKTFFQFCESFIRNADKRINEKTMLPLAPKTISEYKTTFNYLKKYARKHGEPDFHDVDLEFYENFVSFLRKQNLATNTIGKKIQVIKTFLNDAKEKGYNKYNKFQSKRFKKLYEKSDNIYLNEEELNKLYEFDFSKNPRLEKVRDLFIVGCWIGQRYTDWADVTKNNIKGNFLELEQDKTKKKVVIPLHFTVKEIISKYGGRIPNLISNQKFNDYIKEVAKIAGVDSMHEIKKMKNGLMVKTHAPKYSLIGTHTARRSFCTNNYKKGVPTITIMSVSGHTTEKSFLEYIKAEPEEHAAKMLEFWNREQIKVAK